jgi:hypothetical protein
MPLADPMAGNNATNANINPALLGTVQMQPHPAIPPSQFTPVQSTDSPPPLRNRLVPIGTPVGVAETPSRPGTSSVDGFSILFPLFLPFKADPMTQDLPETNGNTPSFFNTPDQLGLSPWVQGPGRLILPGEEALQKATEDDLDFDDDRGAMHSGQLSVCL